MAVAWVGAIAAYTVKANQAHNPVQNLLFGKMLG